MADKNILASLKYIRRKIFQSRDQALNLMDALIQTVEAGDKIPKSLMEDPPRPARKPFKSAIPKLEHPPEDKPKRKRKAKKEPDPAPEPETVNQPEDTGVPDAPEPEPQPEGFDAA